MNRIDLMKEIEAAIKNAETADWWGFDSKAAMAEIDQDLCLAKVEDIPGVGYGFYAISEITAEIKAAIDQAEGEAAIDQLEEGMKDLGLIEEEPKAQPAEHAKSENSGVLDTLLKGSKATTADRTKKIFVAILEQRPETFKGVRAITNAVYEAEAGKKAEGSFFRTFQARFTAAGLIEWSGKAKEPITWK